jgi:hypothetical protein
MSTIPSGAGPRHTSRMTRAALAALAAAVVAAPAWAGSSPALRLVHTSPFVVAGSHFGAHERVTVTMTTTQRIVRHVTARTDGSFSVGFGKVELGRCAGFAVSAVGAAGSRAALKVPRPACMPARGGGATP